MTDLKTLRQLVRLMVDNGLTELDLEGEGERITLKRGGGAPEVAYVQPAAAAVSPQPAAPPTGTPAASEAPGGEDLGPTIDSPMVGTFYKASSPEAEDFVAVGSKVTAESVICIVEAMKVFNEIKAETSGEITEVLVENGQAVEFGQPLFRIKPA